MIRLTFTGTNGVSYLVRSVDLPMVNSALNQLAQMPPNGAPAYVRRWCEAFNVPVEAFDGAPERFLAQLREQVADLANERDTRSGGPQKSQPGLFAGERVV